MMKHDGLEAVYFPGCYPLVESSMFAACVYFSQIHFVTPMMTNQSSDAYTDYLRQSSGKKITISVLGERTDDTAPMIQKVADFWRFIHRTGPLLGEVIRYHPSLRAERTWQMAEKICSSGLPLDDCLNFIERSNEETQALVEQYRGTRIVEDAFLHDILPTTRNLAIQRGFVPLSDDPDLPAPVPEDLRRSANALATSVALKMLRLSLPAPETTEPEAILEIRAKMHDGLQAFRMMALKLAGDLRQVLSEGATPKHVEEEAVFLVKTKVMPHVEDIHRRIRVERGKLWRRVFGKSPKWVSLGLASYADPTGAALSAALREAAKDAAGLLEDAHRLSITGDPGIAFLIQIEKQGRE